MTPMDNPISPMSGGLGGPNSRRVERILHSCGQQQYLMRVLGDYLDEMSFSDVSVSYPLPLGNYCLTMLGSFLDEQGIVVEGKAHLAQEPGHGTGCLPMLLVDLEGYGRRQVVQEGLIFLRDREGRRAVLQIGRASLPCASVVAQYFTAEGQPSAFFEAWEAYTDRHQAGVPVASPELKIARPPRRSVARPSSSSPPQQRAGGA